MYAVSHPQLKKEGDLNMEHLEKRYLERLSELYPTIAETSTEIINLSSILNLPKGTEHFITDIHGNTLRIMPSDGGLLFFDSENAELEPTVMNGYYSFDDERYDNCAFEFTDDSRLYCDLGYRSDLVFRFEDGEFKPFVHGLRTLAHINSYRGAEFFAGFRFSS